MKKALRTKKSSRELVVNLEKRSKHDKTDFWLDIAKRISKPARNEPKVNLWKLSKISAKNKGKTLVVAGKVLGTGDIENGISIAALSFSETARKKIKESKGTVLSLAELADSKINVSEIVIVA
ncbi:MAG: 50S ribosomal protein L18e [Candidatus Diapherotrites archaeon]